MQPSYLSKSRIACAALAGVALYVVIDVLLVFLRPEFSVLHNAESDYGSAGSWAWLMDVNFVLRCLLSLAVVVSLVTVDDKTRRLRVALVLLTVWAIASGLLAIFPDDPAGTLVRGTGRIHVALALIAFLAVLAGTILATSALRRRPRWHALRIPLLILSWGAIVPLLLLGRAGLQPDSLGGLYEKVFLAMQLAWLVLAALPVACQRALQQTETLHETASIG
ncbi:DUF998 domain-containing protein [Rathayibacter soli]|uniref:DUF998 domain-containing protein n=1 Tax=Rathayibacter soli TaxID=3144168 RepID=UPI0027E4B894|nr:DUF998 domain-containing protein [Glaciibacter superstes]